MTGDTSLGYVVADKFSMLTNKTNQNLEKMILKTRRIIKEKLRAKNFRKNYKQKSDIKR